MKKILIGAALLIVAAISALTIKDLIDLKNPLYVVPQITVYADETEIPTVLAGYSWRFAFDNETSELPGSVTEMAFAETQLLGGEKLDIEFTRKPKAVMISRSDPYSYHFNQADDEATVPFEQGGYIYKVYAVFDKGTALYFFYVLV